MMQKLSYRKTRSKQPFIRVLIALLLGYLGLCLLLRWGQTRLMFFPSATLKADPTAVGLAYQEVNLPMPVGNLHGWWIPAQQSASQANPQTDLQTVPQANPQTDPQTDPQSAPVVLFLHGNGSNLGDLVNQAARWHRLDLSLLLIDYRGYGRSRGEFPSETSVYEDAAVAWRYLTETRQIPPDRIVIYGQSIGGAVAIDLAVQQPETGAVIVESSFTSMRAMVDRASWMRLFPVDWLLTQHFDSISKLRLLQVPILLIHGTADQTIPATMSQALYNAAPQPKQLLLIPAADHNNVAQVGGERYWEALKLFLDRFVS